MTTIIVGVSASSGSPHALRAAAAEARAKGADLVAVQAWRPPRPPMSPGGHPPGVSRDLDAARAAAERMLRARVTSALGADVKITCRLVRGAPIPVLLAQSAQADLLVLDAPRARESLSTPLLAHRLIYAAKCPVLVMPAHATNGTNQPDTPHAPHVTEAHEADER